MKKSQVQLKPVVIKFKLSPYRKKVRDNFKPVEPSEYFKHLSKIGAGWK